jgi:hypothetical protein
VSGRIARKSGGKNPERLPKGEEADHVQVIPVDGVLAKLSHSDREEKQGGEQHQHQHQQKAACCCCCAAAAKKLWVLYLVSRDVVLPL